MAASGPGSAPSACVCTRGAFCGQPATCPVAPLRRLGQASPWCRGRGPTGPRWHQVQPVLSEVASGQAFLFPSLVRASLVECRMFK